jgi:hypothetical protein
MGGDATGDVHADRGDLPILYPYAGELATVLRAAAGRDAHLA